MMLPTMQRKLQSAFMTEEPAEVRLALIQWYGMTTRSHTRRTADAVSTHAGRQAVEVVIPERGERGTGEGETSPDPVLPDVGIDLSTSLRRENPNSTAGIDLSASLRRETPDSTDVPRQGSEDPEELDVPGTGIPGYLVPRRVVAEASTGETAFSDPLPSFIDLLRRVQRKDAFVLDHRWGDIEEKDEAGAVQRPWQEDSEGLLRFKGSIYVPRDPAVRAEILKMNHDDPLGGHLGVARTLEVIRRKYFWDGLIKDIKAYVRDCDVCQRNKVPRHRPYGELQSLPQPSRPWQEITMDFITGLPLALTYEGIEVNSILVVLCRFTKFAWYVAVMDTLTADQLAELFVEKFLFLGIPEGIVSDRGTLFTSKFWSTFCYLLKIRRKLSTAFHPQTDGQTERQNQSLEHYLRCYVNYHMDDWPRWLPMAQRVYIDATQTVIQETPMRVLFGFTPRWEVDIQQESLDSEAPLARDRVAAMEQVREELSKRLKTAQESQKKYYDRAHQPMQYRVGDEVLLSAKNITTKRAKKKLDNRFLGPFVIEAVRGTQAYQLKLPFHYPIHHTFHVSLLEPYHRRPGVEPPTPMEIEGQLEWNVAEILEVRERRKKQQFLVRWEGFPPSEDSWEPMEHLQNCKEALADFWKTQKKGKAKSRKRRRVDDTG